MTPETCTGGICFKRKACSQFPCKIIEGEEQPKPEMKWTCSHCTTKNPIFKLKCEACGKHAVEWRNR
jgi:hypothetical protein